MDLWKHICEHHSALCINDICMIGISIIKNNFYLTFLISTYFPRGSSKLYKEFKKRVIFHDYV